MSDSKNKSDGRKRAATAFMAVDFVTGGDGERSTEQEVPAPAEQDLEAILSSDDMSFIHAVFSASARAIESRIPNAKFYWSPINGVIGAREL